MVTWFRGVVQSAKDTASGVRIAKAIGRGVRELSDVALHQQRGFTSVPLDGETAVFLQANDLVVAIASGMKDKPNAEPGETVLYSNSDTKVSLKPDGSILVKGTTVVIEADQVANVMAPQIGLGKDGLLGTPLERPVTTGCECIFGVKHPVGAAGVTLPMVPSP